MFDFFGYLTRNVNAALVTELLAAAACPDQLRKEAAGRWVGGGCSLIRKTNKQTKCVFFPTNAFQALQTNLRAIELTVPGKCAYNIWHIYV